MNFFRKTLGWIKANLFIVICAVLAVLSIGLTVVVHMQGVTFREDVSKRDAELKTIEGLIKKGVQIPPATPDGQPRTLQITINQAALDDIREVYRKLSVEYSTVFRRAMEINQKDHQPMLEQLFPEPSKQPSRPYEARIRYRSIFQGKPEAPVGDFLQRYSPTAGYPQLNAKPAPRPEETKALLDRVRAEYTGSLFKTDAQLTPAEQLTLQNLQADGLKKLFIARASEIHMYAETDARSGAFPLQVMEWQTAKQTPPTDREIWEGQMQVWIQQDICQALAICNQVSNQDRKVNVMNMPVKHLLKIEVPPLNVTTPTKDAGAPIKPGAGRLDVIFGASPTGRVSNPLYDVRHAKVTLIADVTRLPELFNAISQVNFMSVTRMEMADIDAYQAFKDGYVYGGTNPMKITLTVETIWFREWTMKLMPEDVIKTGGIAGGAATPGAAGAPLARPGAGGVGAPPPTAPPQNPTPDVPANQID